MSSRTVARVQPTRPQTLEDAPFDGHRDSHAAVAPEPKLDDRLDADQEAVARTRERGADELGADSRTLTHDFEARSDRLTEAGAAERFARLCGDRVRFDHRRQRWLMWRQHRWQPDKDAAVTRLAIKFAREWQRQAFSVSDVEKRSGIVNFAMRFERRSVMSNMLALARTLAPITDAGDRWDSDPYLLGVPNGIVDLRTATIRDGDPSDQITMQTGVPYEVWARCPRWEQFISEVFAGDASLIAFIQRAIGYSLTGITSEQVLFLLYGSGANGKSTLADPSCPVDVGSREPVADEHVPARVGDGVAGVDDPLRSRRRWQNGG